MKKYSLITGKKLRKFHPKPFYKLLNENIVENENLDFGLHCTNIDDKYIKKENKKNKLNIKKRNFLLNNNRNYGLLCYTNLDNKCVKKENVENKKNNHNYGCWFTDLENISKWFNNNYTKIGIINIYPETKVWTGDLTEFRTTHAILSNIIPIEQFANESENLEIIFMLIKSNSLYLKKENFIKIILVKILILFLKLLSYSGMMDIEFINTTFSYIFYKTKKDLNTVIDKFADYKENEYKYCILIDILTNIIGNKYPITYLNRSISQKKFTSLKNFFMKKIEHYKYFGFNNFQLIDLLIKHRDHMITNLYLKKNISCPNKFLQNLDILVDNDFEDNIIKCRRSRKNFTSNCKNLIFLLKKFKPKNSKLFRIKLNDVIKNIQVFKKRKSK